MALAIAGLCAAFATMAGPDGRTDAIQLAIDRSIPIAKGPVQETLEDMGLYARWEHSDFMRWLLDTLGLLYSRELDGNIVSADGTYETASPTETALAIVAELAYVRDTGDASFAAMRHYWLLGLQDLHVPGRGFRKAPDQLAESDEVNGAVWYAMAEYSRTISGDVDALAFLANVDDYMLERYGTAPSAEFRRWGSKAAASRLAMTGDGRFAALAGATQ
jgi:hypothetical protein